MNIRDAKITDVDEILELGKNEFQVSEKVVSFWPKEILINCINSKTDFLLVAEENQKIIGFIIANYNPNFKKAIIENIFVRPDFGFQDVGKELLKSLLDRLEGIKCGYVCALVESDREKAINFYIKEGLNRGIDCIWLDKILEKSFRK